MASEQDTLLPKHLKTKLKLKKKKKSLWIRLKKKTSWKADIAHKKTAVKFCLLGDLGLSQSVASFSEDQFSSGSFGFVRGWTSPTWAPRLRARNGRDLEAFTSRRHRENSRAKYSSACSPLMVLRHTLLELGPTELSRFQLPGALTRLGEEERSSS